MEMDSGWEDEKVMEMDSGDSSTTVWLYLMPLNFMITNS